MAALQSFAVGDFGFPRHFRSCLSPLRSRYDTKGVDRQYHASLGEEHRTGKLRDLPVLLSTSSGIYYTSVLA